jgi:hypothetical protein
MRCIEHNSLEKAFGVTRKVEKKNMFTRRVTTTNYIENHVPSHKLTQPTRLTPLQMDEIREK